MVEIRRAATGRRFAGRSNDSGEESSERKVLSTTDPQTLALLSHFRSGEMAAAALYLTARVAYARRREDGRRAGAAATIGPVPRWVQWVFQPPAAGGGGEPVPRRAVQRQRAEVDAGDAWPPERSGPATKPCSTSSRIRRGTPRASGAASAHGFPVRAGILALDDTGFPKQGTRSVGVQRQYLRRAREDWQLSGRGVECVDRRGPGLAARLRPVLRRPRGSSDAARRAAAGIPATVRFREKWRIALAHIRTDPPGGLHAGPASSSMRTTGATRLSRRA